jgi:hypothetical protein
LRFGKRVEVLRPEIDASGFDVVLECEGILRHVQLKTTRAGGRATKQKVNIALGSRIGGCIVWLVRSVDEERQRVAFTYRFFGGGPGDPLPPLDGFRVARHVKGNAQGIKAERPAIRWVPKGQFEEFADVGALLERMFGIQPRR